MNRARSSESEFPPLPSLASLGGPPQYRQYRRNQEESVWRALESDKRFVAIVAPTGFGKTVSYVAYLLMRAAADENYRACILTHTRPQQDQIIGPQSGDFRSMPNWIDQRGQSNYTCTLEPRLKVSDGPCHAGYRCEFRSVGCPYYDQIRRAAIARVAVTNYAFWLSANAYGEGIGSFSTLVCDEAHLLRNALSGFLQIEISRAELKELIPEFGPPSNSLVTEEWVKWCRARVPALQEEMDEAVGQTAGQTGDSGISKARSLKLKRFIMKVSRLALLQRPKNWITDRTSGPSGGGWRFDPIDPGELAEPYLYRKTPKVIFISATIRPKTLALLGLKEEDYDFFEFPSTFPISRRPIYSCPATLAGRPIAVTFRQPESTLKQVVKHADRIISARQDRKGIYHTKSYPRAAWIRRLSAHSGKMIWHSDAAHVRQAVRKFRERGNPAILLSPSVTTGLSFPYGEAEYQIIFKVPYPDMQDAVLKARQKIDPEYSYYLAAQELEQAVGRAMRAEDDQCETFVTDAMFYWFVRKYRKFFSRAFLDAIVWLRPGEIPRPPKTLPEKSEKEVLTRSNRKV